MTTTAARNAIHAGITADIRRATSPSLPEAEQSIEERRMALLNRARACHTLMTSYIRAGQEETAARYLARGLAIKAELAKLEGN